MFIIKKLRHYLKLVDMNNHLLIIKFQIIFKQKLSKYTYVWHIVIEFYNTIHKVYYNLIKH